MPRVKRQRSVGGGGGAVSKRYKGAGVARKRLSFRMSMSSIQRQVHHLVQGVEGSISIQNSLGWGALGVQSLQFCFTQQGVYYSLGGGALTSFGTGVFSNANALAAIYDQYRITRVNVEIMYSCNNSSENSPTIALPILYAVVDYDDTAALGSSAQALGYSSCKTLQLGNSSGGGGGKQYMSVSRPAVPTNVQTATGVNANGALLHSPWLNSDTTTTEHNGMKFYYVPVTSNATLVGYVTFVFRVFFDYKNVK